MSDRRDLARRAPELYASIQALRSTIQSLTEERDTLRAALRQTNVALRVALHYTEAPYDGAGAEELIGCRMTERSTAELLSTTEDRPLLTTKHLKRVGRDTVDLADDSPTENREPE